VNAPRILLGDLTVGSVHSLADALRSLGFDPATLLEQFGLDRLRLGEPQARLSIPRYMRLGHAAIQLSGDLRLGLRMGQHARLAQLGIAGVTAAQAPNVREAARVLTRFELLHARNCRGQSSLHEDSAGAWLRFYSISPYNDYNRFVVDSVLSGWHSQLSELCGSRLALDKVEIEFAAPAGSERYSELFGCPVEFSAATNQLRLSQSALALRGSQHCPHTWMQLLEICERELEVLTRTHSLRERVALLLGPLLQGREPDVQEVARRLQMPPWTLRRKLADEGTQFRSILNETRRDLAITYIRDTELSFGEIAYLLGFASAEAFQRAFKRWCASTPGEFRRARRQAG
jgi:AraC-like DNA-binding protein